VKNHKADSAESLEAICHRLIPISAAMGVRVQSYADSRLTLSAPLANNINHQESAFGGSLFSLAALAGWGILQLELTARSLDANVVIADGNVTYRRPVFSDFQCVCDFPEEAVVSLDRLTSEGKAALKLVPRIEVDGKVAMELSGNYVVLLTS
jgi:thioesterase domain-containing protein